MKPANHRSGTFHRSTTLAVALTAAIVAACSSATPEETNTGISQKDGGTATKAPASGGGNGAAASASSDGGTTVGIGTPAPPRGDSSGAKACASSLTEDGCQLCCSNEFPQDLHVNISAERKCLCAVPNSKCATACKAYCASGNRDDDTFECSDCMMDKTNRTPACKQAGEVACAKDTVCNAQLTCAKASKCDGKPPTAASLTDGNAAKNKCKAEKDHDVCVECCEKELPDATYYSSLAECVCKRPSSKCKDACAKSLCGSAGTVPADDACAACIEGDNYGACYGFADVSCKENPKCSVQDACVALCPPRAELPPAP
jgi:hypothetical protein